MASPRDRGAKYVEKKEEAKKDGAQVSPRKFSHHLKQTTSVPDGAGSPKTSPSPSNLFAKKEPAEQKESSSGSRRRRPNE